MRAAITVTAAKHTAGTGPFPSYLILVVLGGSCWGSPGGSGQARKVGLFGQVVKKKIISILDIRQQFRYKIHTIHMELFERIRYISEKKRVSLAKIATHIGESPQTFGKWLTLGSQRNLWAHLPKIEELFPDVRPDWLWRGSGPIFGDGSGEEPQPPVSIGDLQKKITELEAELKEERALNRRLTERLLEK